MNTYPEYGYVTTNQKQFTIVLGVCQGVSEYKVYTRGFPECCY